MGLDTPSAAFLHTFAYSFVHVLIMIFNPNPYTIALDLPKKNEAFKLKFPKLELVLATFCKVFATA